MVDEVNELLSAQENALTRARAQASDLAHGLKTPLTILSSLAPALASAGQTESAKDIDEQVNAMRRRIDWQLARARLGPGRFATTKFDLLVNQLVDLVRRSPPGARIAWDVAVEHETVISVDEVDAAEAIGNLLENAAKWARSTVRIEATQEVWPDDHPRRGRRAWGEPRRLRSDPSAGRPAEREHGRLRAWPRDRERHRLGLCGPNRTRPIRPRRTRDHHDMAAPGRSVIFGSSRANPVRLLLPLPLRLS